MRHFKVIFVALLFIFAIIFIKQNLAVLEHEVTLRFNIYIHTFESAPIPLWVLLLFIGFIGAFTVSLFLLYEWLRHRQTIRHLQHNLEILTDEIKSYHAREAARPAPSHTGQTEEETQPGSA